MKILITGSNGYIGKNLVDFFSATNDVTTLTRETHNLRNPIDFSEHFDIIIHCAGNPSAKKCIDDPHSAIQDNIIATYNVLEYAKRMKIKKLVFLSTCEVYTGNIDACENDLPNCTNMYSATKLSCEHICQAYFNSYDFMDTCVILRLIHSYGKYCQDDRFPSIVKRKFESEKCPHFILKTTTPKRWISTDEICEKINILIHNFTGYSVFNLVGDENLSLHQFILKFGENYTYEYDTSFVKKGYPNESNARGDKLTKFINSVTSS